MFWRDDGKVSVAYPLVGVIAAGVIALAAWLWLVFFPPQPVAPAPRQTQAEADTGQTVNERYRAAFISLRAEVGKSQTVAGAVDTAEQAFFSVRVPSELLDTHLSALLKIRQLKGEANTERIKRSIIATLDALIKKSQSL